MMNPNALASLLDDLKRDEGLKLHSYQDSLGIWTIGYGTNLQTLEIDVETAESWLEDRAEQAARDAVDLLGPVPFMELSEVRQRVLVNMAYNLGGRGLAKFGHFLAAMRAGNWELATKEMLDSLWAKQVRSRAVRLAYMILNNKEPTDAAVMMAGVAHLGV